MSLIKPRKPKAVAEQIPAMIATPFEDRLLRVEEVMQALDVKSKETVYKYVRQGLLPAPIKLSARASRWRLSDIQAFISQKAGTPKAAVLRLVNRASEVGNA